MRKLLAIFVLALVSCAFANTITDNITYTGNPEVTEVGDEVIIKYTSNGTLQFKKGSAAARVLAVGGGGGGGGGAVAKTSQYSGGGGGGAGGFIDKSGLVFKGAYTITIGQGGSGGIASNNNGEGVGEDGTDTILKQNDAVVSGIQAYGGGGGGSMSNGRSGGSGGGGSQIRNSSTKSTPSTGGSASEQGHAGGNTDAYRVGAGGGGAGASGTPTTSNTQKGSPGGAGKSSDITGQSVVYAGGGAGGISHDTQADEVKGGDGGGGSGGARSYNGSRDGKDGLGGGGGGGAGSDFPGGKGGDGVLIIRLSNYIPGGVTIPTIEDKTYDRTAQTALENDPLYTVSDDYKATNAGEYTLTMTLTQAGKDIGWDEDFKDDPRISGDTATVTWKIKKREIEEPVKTQEENFVYNGEERQGYQENDWYTFDDQNKQKNADTYTTTATLKDNTETQINTCWKKDGSSAPRTGLVWTIEKKEIDRPLPKKGDFTFKNETLKGYEESADYSLEENEKIHAGSYEAKATLTDPANTKWKGGDSEPLSGLKWKIDKRYVAPPRAPTTETIKLAYNGHEQSIFTATPDETWYALSGLYQATDAGTYSCTATLRYNDEVENVVWSGNRSEPITWNWEITKQDVPKPQLTKTKFVYDKTEQQGYQTGSLYSLSEDNKGTDVKTYTVTATLTDSANYQWEDGADDPRSDLKWTIEKAENEIRGFKMDDWQVGTTESIPRVGSVQFGSTTDVKFSYGEQATGPWAETKITTNGYHYVRAFIAGTDNYHEAETNLRYCVWRHPSEVFTNFVDITISEVTAETPVIIKLQEPVEDTMGVVAKGLPGFKYDDAGRDGKNIRFISRNGTEQTGDDKLLPYKVKSWNVSGESSVVVLVPRPTSGSDAVVRLYWQTNDPESANDPDLVEGTGVEKSCSFDLVNRAGTWVDYWTEAPSITKENWDISAPPSEADINNGSLKRGTVNRFFVTLPQEAVTNATIQTAAGYYNIIFDREEDESETILYKGARTLFYEISEHNLYNDLGGTASGRILLGNNDTMEGHEIQGQAYWQTSTELSAANTYWEHDATEPAAFYDNLGNGTVHILNKIDEVGVKHVLWRLYNVRLGNHSNNSGGLVAARNYLPWSSTTQPRTSGTAVIGDNAKEITYLVLRDAQDAIIYSPCYTNGIGTIYFDAVNGYAADPGSIVVEMATKTTEGKDPTDENCAARDGSDQPYFYLDHNENGSQLDEDEDMWEPVKPLVLIKEKESTEFVVDRTQTGNAIQLAITSGGGKDAFYRIIINKNYMGAARFRIRRVTNATTAFDTARLVVLDNILVSPPAMHAELEAVGAYDQDAAGKQTLGYACAFDKPFPAVSDTELRGRARISYVAPAGVAYDESEFVSSARLNWRWRYLNQSFEPAKVGGADQWNTLYLDHQSIQDGVLTTVKPLVLNGAVGDIEWFYELGLKAPAYQYVDYSGAGLAKPTGDFSEEIRAWTNRVVMAEGDRFASGGTDWFARLREGRSDWQGMEVIVDSTNKTAKSIAGTYKMELTGDHLWRAFVLIPTNAEGQCSYYFRGFNRQEGSPTQLQENTKFFGFSDNKDAPIPSTDKLEEYDEVAKVKKTTITLDHVAGYLEFTMSDQFKTYQVGRAEYQDFNYWNDAKTEGDKFKFDATDTNSVNVADMKIGKAPIASWPIYSSVYTNWNERFGVADYATTDGRFAKDIFHQSHETPNSAAWMAQNITFVSEKFVSSDEIDQKNNSGMAGKLLGSGSGLMDYSSAEAPKGIETISLSARIGQSMTFDSFSYNYGTPSESDYTFFVPVTMSHNTKEDGSETGDMAVGAGVSLVGYYSPREGCYEARVERLYSHLGKSSKGTIRITLYKWMNQGYQWLAKKLCFKDFDETICWSKEKETTAEGGRNYHGFFISLKTEFSGGDPIGGDPLKTVITCGLSEPSNGITAKEPWKPFITSTSGTGKKWVGLRFEDQDYPYGWGSYGVAAKDCPAKFPVPCHQFHPVFDSIKFDKSESYVFTKQTLSFTNELGELDFEHDRANLASRRKWALAPGRAECFTDSKSGSIADPWTGLQMPTNLTQKIELYLKPRGKGEENWELMGSKSVTGYGFSSKEFTIRRAGTWDVRLRTGSEVAVDVVVDNIEQTCWQAEDIPSQLNVETGFIYTQGLVETNEAAETCFLKFQPSRAVATRPISIRSPLLDGLGKFTFSYQGVDPHAEVWVQVATNQVYGNMSGDKNYNESIRSIELGEREEVGEWITVARYRAGHPESEYNLNQSSQKTFYLGWHNHPDRPVKGVFRLFVPTNVVQEAALAMTNSLQTTAYGQITITGVTCTDEPGFSDRSWYGLNLRTIGDSVDGEKRMNLVDMKIDDGGSGLVAALNNSTKDVYDRNGEKVKENEPRLNAVNPTIFSPTMKSTNADQGVGSVSFKARLYSTTGKPTTVNGGRIVLSGATDSRVTNWKVLSTNEITESVFRNFRWDASNTTYKAVKFEVIKNSDVDRVIIDEIVIGEKVPPTIGFKYARPFRNNLFSHEPIADILSPAEQPLVGESWGVQTQLTLQQLTDEIDTSRGFEVSFAYYRGETPWGYSSWEKNAKFIPLELVGEPTNYIYRSVGESSESLVEPRDVRGETVQFMVRVEYYDHNGNKSKPVFLTGGSWQQPEWYYPIDRNLENGAAEDAAKFSAYTVLDTVSPGRAWINEVNWNDGVKSEHGGKECITNQFIEVCIPSGVDMTGWKIRVTDFTEKQSFFAKFGDKTRNIPASKVSAHAVNGYEFFVLQSPETRSAGGIRYQGENVADATWYKTPLGDEVVDGTLDYGSPYQFELIRPSGIIEHQFVLDGTNTLASFGFHEYDGTNLVVQLNAADLEQPPYYESPKRFYAGQDVAWKVRRQTLASVGVIGGSNSVDTANWPGGENTWAEGMGFTPGRLNEGQKIPENWFLAPNGTNSWVYFIVDTPHITQTVGDQTGSSILVVIPHGKSTNVNYRVDNWYEGSVKTNDILTIVGEKGEFNYSVEPDGTLYVKASAVPEARLKNVFGLTEDNPYSDAVQRWLEENYPDATADDIRLARYKGLNKLDMEDWLSLTEMYWFNIPPVPQTPEELASNAGTNWWLRAGVGNIGGTHYIYRTRGGEEVTYTNRQIDVTMYISNAVWATETRAPDRLQGMGGESSAEYSGIWTSVTFKVMGKLNLTTAEDFLPFRLFTFNEESFTGAEGDATKGIPPYTTRIDIMDPFSSPIGRSYRWNEYPNTSAYFIFRINDKQYPFSVETLKSDSTYPERINQE